MSYQRLATTTGIPGSASYSEFLKDIYFSLRSLTTGLSTINTRLDTISTQLQNLENKIIRQDQQAEFLSARIDTLIQQTQTTQIRQSTNSLSLLSELDAIGTRQVEPSAAINNIATKLNNNSQIPASRFLFSIPEINITEQEIADINIPEQEKSEIETLNSLEFENHKQNIQPGTTLDVAPQLHSQIMEQPSEPMKNSEQLTINNFLIL